MNNDGEVMMNDREGDQIYLEEDEEERARIEGLKYQAYQSLRLKKTGKIRLRSKLSLGLIYGLSFWIKAVSFFNKKPRLVYFHWA